MSLHRHLASHRITFGLAIQRFHQADSFPAIDGSFPACMAQVDRLVNQQFCPPTINHWVIGQHSIIDPVDQPVFQPLKEPGKKRAFPIELDPFEHTRSEMAAFAFKCQQVGVNYIGTCCGAGQHHVRAMADALGRRVPASRYSSDLSQDAMLRNNVLGHNQELLSRWKD